MMREFFRGWRRKAGCVTLLMACVVMIAWGRSYFSEDHVWVAYSNQQAFALHTQVGCFALGREWQEVNGSHRVTDEGATLLIIRFNPSKFLTWTAHPADDQPDKNSWGVMRWFWSFGKLGYGEWDDGDMGFRLLAIPYWVLVLPLTLLSGYLILWKPCHRRCTPQATE